MTHDDSELFKKLEPYVQEYAKGAIEKDSIFALCVRASLAKCYEFNMFVRANRASLGLFFCLPALRGVCEDVILLSFVESWPDRDEFLTKHQLHDTRERLDLQEKFFREVRPQQSVLSGQKLPHTKNELESELRQIWASHGWNLNYGSMPQIRQLAAKQGPAMVSRLYDYLYKLTSGTVHFSVRSLLRLGWSESDKETTFSTRHLSQYDLAFATIYGTYLFCLYFEIFTNQLQPCSEVKGFIKELRQGIQIIPRWPEMVTFEEMNVPLPNPNLMALVYGLVQATQTQKLMD